jgi:hypothetical protein
LPGALLSQDCFDQLFPGFGQSIQTRQVTLCVQSYESARVVENNNQRLIDRPDALNLLNARTERRYRLLERLVPLLKLAQLGVQRREPLSQGNQTKPYKQ